MAASPKTWTADEDALFTRWVKDGRTNEQLAARFGCSKGQAQARRSALKLTTPRAHEVWAKEEDAALEWHWRAGVSDADIARILAKKFARDFTKNSVLGRRKRLKLNRTKESVLLDSGRRSRAQGVAGMQSLERPAAAHKPTQFADASLFGGIGGKPDVIVTAAFRTEGAPKRVVIGFRQAKTIAARAKALRAQGAADGEIDEALGLVAGEAKRIAHVAAIASGRRGRGEGLKAGAA